MASLQESPVDIVVTIVESHEAPGRAHISQRRSTSGERQRR